VRFKVVAAPVAPPVKKIVIVRKAVARAPKEPVKDVRPKPIRKEPLVVYPGWDLYRDGVSQSMLLTFMSCPEKFRLGTVEGLTSTKPSAAMNFGTIVHDILEKAYTFIKEESEDPSQQLVSGSITMKDAADEFISGYMTTKEQEDRQLVRDLKAADPQAGQDLEENYGMAEAVLTPYFDQWPEDLDKEWLELEKTFQFTFKGKYGDIPVRGKRDGAYRSRKTSKIRLREIKSKGKIDEDAIMDKLPIDFQVLLYSYALMLEYGECPDGVEYDLVRRPQLKQGKKQTLRQFIDRVKADVKERPAWYYLRYNSPILEKELLAWFAKDFTAIMHQLEEWYKGAFHYKNTSACILAAGMTCPFLGVCSRGDKSRLRTKSTPFPELVSEGE
jgi:hypothetical protein